MALIHVRLPEDLHLELVAFCELSTASISATTTLALTLFLEAYPEGLPEDLQAEIKSRSKRGRKPGRGRNRGDDNSTGRNNGRGQCRGTAHGDDAGHDDDTDAGRRPTATSSSRTPALPGTTAETPAPLVPEARRKGRPPRVRMTPEQQARHDAFMLRHYAEQDAIDEEDARSLREERMNAEKLLEQQRAQVIAERMRQLGKA